MTDYSNGHCAKSLYEWVCSDSLLYTAYDNLSNRSGIVATGVDHMSLDNMTLERLDCLRKSLINGTYFPSPSKRIYISKKKGGARPLSIPCTDDKLVQEEVRILLDIIYNQTFNSHSHGYRTGMGIHSAISDIKMNFKNVKWIIEGDIKGCFDNINHDILMNLLRQRIDDDKFLLLIEKFLKAGYLENGIYKESRIGTPQGGLISPILTNIYLDMLDRRISNISSTLQEKIRYVRYADDFLIGVDGDEDDCRKIKKVISSYLADNLRLELSEEKTLITPSTKKILFLGNELMLNKETNEMVIISTDGRTFNDKQMHKPKHLTTPLFVPTRMMVDRLKKEVCEMCGSSNILIMRQLKSKKILSALNPLHKKILERTDCSVAICPKCNYSLNL